MTAPLLQTRNLVCQFGGVRAVNHVSFSLAPGELRCLIGPNGAGKSTFFKMLCGLQQPTSGEVHFCGRSITGWAPHRIARLGVGIKTQTPSVFEGLTVHENLLLGAEQHTKGIWARRKAEALLDRLGLQSIARCNVNRISHGQRQWVELGIVLSTEPKILLLDEPIAGMTKDETDRTLTLVHEINREASVIVVEHDMHFIRRMGGRVTVFHEGRILIEDEAGTVLSDPKVREVYLGARRDA